MRWMICGIAVAGLLSGCATLGWGAADARPQLLVHGHEWNAPILNPDPPVYGDGQPGGCIVMGEFRVEIDQLAYDPATDRLRLSVRVEQVGSGPTVGTFRTRDDTGALVATTAVPGSPLSLDLLLAQNPTLTIDRVAMRSLQIDLRLLSRRATRAGG